MWIKDFGRGVCVRVKKWLQIVCTTCHKDFGISFRNLEISLHEFSISCGMDGKSRERDEEARRREKCNNYLESFGRSIINRYQRAVKDLLINSAVLKGSDSFLKRCQLQRHVAVAVQV
jgi:hypothetical protein